MHRDQQRMLLFAKPDQAPADQWPRFQIKLGRRLFPHQMFRVPPRLSRLGQIVFQQVEPALLRRRDTLCRLALDGDERRAQRLCRATIRSSARRKASRSSCPCNRHL